MRRRFEAKCYDEINITPLMDTVFFLLIIFMITAPLLEYSFDVTPPAMKAGKLKANEYSKTININKSGQIEFEKKIISNLKSIKTQENPINLIYFKLQPGKTFILETMF